MTKNDKMPTRQHVHEKYENERKTKKCPKDSLSTKNIKITKNPQNIRKTACPRRTWKWQENNEVSTQHSVSTRIMWC